jgi:hypothetical protein
MAGGCAMIAAPNQSDRLRSEAGIRLICPVYRRLASTRTRKTGTLRLFQQIADVYWLGDIGSASTLQSVRFIGWRYEGGHGNDWDVLRLVIFLQ